MKLTFMFMKLTHDFQKAVVSYEKFVAVDDFNSDVEFYMLGSEAQPYVKETLIPNCGYVFRKTMKGGYVPKRVTMNAFGLSESFGID